MVKVNWLLCAGCCVTLLLVRGRVGTTAAQCQPRASSARAHQPATTSDFEAMLKRITDKVRDSLDESQILQTAVEELALYCIWAVVMLPCITSPKALPLFAMSTQQSYPRFKDVAHMACPKFTISSCKVVFPVLLFPNPVRGQVAMLACPVVDDKAC